MRSSTTSSELKKLSRAAMTPDNFLSAIGMREGEDDRSAAIVVSATVENLLADTLRLRMQHLSADEDRALFENNGPLSTLSAKIQIAYALKLFNKTVLHDLHILREIRNAFAHTQLSITFSTKEVEAMCSRFLLIKEPLLKSASQQVESKTGLERNTPRGRFLFSANLLSLMLLMQFAPDKAPWKQPPA